MKKGKTFGVILLILLILAGASMIFMRTTASAQQGKGESAAEAVPLKFHNPFAAATPEPGSAFELLTLPACTPPVTEAGQLLEAAWRSVRGYEPAGELQMPDRDSARQILRTYTLDLARLSADLNAACAASLPAWTATEEQRAALFDDTSRSLRPEALRAKLPELLRGLFAADSYRLEQSLELNLAYADKSWTVQNADALAAQILGGLTDPDAAAESLLGPAAAVLPYVARHYSIPEDALAGPVPNPAGFGETDDPAVVEALLQRPEAQTLINGQTLVWNAGIERIPNTPIRYYLDETILCLVWQEREARGVGTFSEVFIADGSQLRRKIAADTLWDFHFQTTSSFAQSTNAVLAVGGDFYHHGRNCGIGIYQRQLFRFEPKTCDVCYITSDGDMLFSYREQFSEQWQAEQFVQENDVLFSLAFGPVLIDNGVDVTPDRYLWGEILDEYARSALGMLGRHHYLTMNINCGKGEYYYLATLRQAADAMIRRGCIKAYALDGGQTATTAFHGQLINPVQFGWEKDISDVIYFATAIPN